MRRLLCLAFLATALSHSVSALAATSAYWRHEEGTSGGLIPAGAGTVLDSSGNNHMRTFNPAFTSATYTSTVSPLPLRSGLANMLSLDFGPGGDDAGQNDDNYSEGASVNSQSFGAITIEAAFRMDAISGYQAILGKDGKPTASVVPPLKVLVRGDDFPDAIPNQLFVEWIDGDGDVHFLAGGETVAANQWYHMAVTIGAADARLWVANETGPYTLVDSLSSDFAGPGGDVIFPDATNWSIGRGMFNNGVADWADAHIDEVRISDAALTADELLFRVVPEPASATLLLVAVAVAVRRRRVRR
jgi:hypothetical protein